MWVKLGCPTKTDVHLTVSAAQKSNKNFIFYVKIPVIKLLHNLTLFCGCTELNGNKNFIEKNSVSIGDFVEIYFIAEYLTNGSLYDSTFVDIVNKTS